MGCVSLKETRFSKKEPDLFKGWHIEKIEGLVTLNLHLEQGLVLKGAEGFYMEEKKKRARRAVW